MNPKRLEVTVSGGPGSMPVEAWPKLLAMISEMIKRGARSGQHEHVVRTGPSYGETVGDRDTYDFTWRLLP